MHHQFATFRANFITSTYLLVMHDDESRRHIIRRDARPYAGHDNININLNQQAAAESTPNACPLHRDLNVTENSTLCLSSSLANQP